MAGARENARILSAVATSQSLGHHITTRQVLAPRDDAWNPTLDQGLDQKNTTNFATLTNDVRDCPADTPVQYPFQAFQEPSQANNCQGDEANSWDQQAELQNKRITYIRTKIREQ